MDIERSARISGRPAIPPFQGGSVIRLSSGKLSVNLLQLVKRTNTPLITLTKSVIRLSLGKLSVNLLQVVKRTNILYNWKPVFGDKITWI